MTSNAIRRASGAVIRFAVLSAALAGLGAWSSPALAGAFTPGNIVAYRVFNSGANGVGKAANSVFLDEYAPDGTLVQSIAMPTAAGTAPQSNALTASSTGSEGLLNRTIDGTCLTVPGYSAAVGTAAVISASGVQRVVGFVDASGAVNTTTTLGTTAFAGSNVRGAVSDTCSHAWVSGNGTATANWGVWYANKGSSAGSQLYAAVATQGIAIANGQLYTSVASASLNAVGAGLPASGAQALSVVPGVAVANYRGIAFLTLQPGSTASDTLYLMNNTGTKLDKYTYSSGTAAWTLAGSLSLTSLTGATVQGLAAVKLGDGNVALYFTNGNAGIIYRAIDDSGPTGSGPAGFTTFATAAGQPLNAVIYGVALAPVAALPTAAPNAPGNVTSTSVTASSFVASWTAPVGGAAVDGYVVEVSTNAFASIAQTILVPATTTSVTVGNLTGTSNYYRVRAINGFGASADATSGINLGQTITFGAPPVVSVGGTGTLNATASSGLAVVFASTTPSVCTVNASTVTGVAAGTCTVTADQPGNAQYTAAPEVTQTFSVGGAPQSIVFGAAPALVVGGSGALSANASSGLPVSFASTTPAVCTVSGSTVTGVVAGTCTVTADQSGNANYLPAPEATQNFSVGPGTQAISFGAAPTVAFNGTGTLSATATSGLAVTFSSNTPAVCTVSGSTVTGVAVGACTVAANQPGNANYLAAAAVSQSFNVGPASQTIGFSSVPSVVLGGTGTLTAVATSGLPVTFSSTTPGICTVSGNVVTAVGTGKCTITADQGGNGNYLAAATASEFFVVSNAITAFTPGSLVINTFTNVNNGGANLDSAVPIVLQQFQLDSTGATATQTGALTLPQSASGSQWAISGEFGSASEGMLAQSANGQYLTLMGYGVNAAAFNTGGAAVYGNAALGQTTSLPAGAQTGTVVATVPRVVALIGANAGVDTSTALTGLYNTNNPRSVATIDGTAFWTSGQGATTIDPSQGVAYALFGATTATAVDNSTDTRTVAFVISGSGNALWVSRDRKAATGPNDSTNISILAAADGSVPTGSSGLVTAQQVPPASPLSLGANNSSINLTAATANGVNNARIGSFVYLSPEQFFLASPTVLYVTDSGQPKAGSANAAGLGEGGLQKWVLVNGTWTLAYDLVNGLNLVNNANANSTTPAAPGVTGLIGLAGRVVGNTVQLFASSYGLNELSQSYLYEITDDINATANSQVASEQFTVLFTDASGQTLVRGVAFAPGLQQQITFGVAPVVVVGGAGTLSASGGASGNAVVFTSLATDVCTVSGSTVTGVSAGTCTIAANQAGNATYAAAAQATLSFAVSPIAQTIAFGPLPDQQLGAAPITLGATASSGLAVSFASATASVCAVNGNTLTLLTTGVCTVTASQAGNATYAAATSVSQSFTVNPASSGGGTGGSGGADVDVPLPPWAYALLAVSLLGAMRRARRGGRLPRI
jgi:hypothetical protein